MARKVVKTNDGNGVHNNQNVGRKRQSFDMYGNGLNSIFSGLRHLEQSMFAYVCASHECSLGLF